MNSLDLSLLCARLCAASYPGQTTKLSTFFDYHDHVHGDEHGADVFIGSHPLYNFVVFRGTEVHEDSFSFKDVLTDLKFSLKKVPDNDYHLHRGFFEAWREVAPAVTEKIGTMRYEQAWLDSTDKPWVFTGHSLGAAMAAVAAATYGPAECITFGGPRVGGPLFVERLEQRTLWTRWVNKGDWCPRLPPAWLGYEHGGRLAYIDTTANLHIDPAPAFLRKEFLNDFFNKWKRHGIERYVDNITDLVVASVATLPAPAVSSGRGGES